MKISELFGSLFGKKAGETAAQLSAESLQTVDEEQTPEIPDEPEVPVTEKTIDRYSPMARREEAAALVAKADALKDEENYEGAITLLEESASILEKVCADGETGERYDLPEDDDRDGAVRAQVTACLHELASIAQSLSIIYMEMKNGELCRDALALAETRWLRYDGYHASKESKEDLMLHYYTAFCVGHYLGDEEMAYRNAMRYQQTTVDAAALGAVADEAAQKDLKLSCNIILDGIKADPARAEKYLDLLDGMSAHAAVIDAGDLLNAFAVLAMRILGFYVENGYAWTVNGRDAKAVMLCVIRMASGALAEHGQPENCAAFTGYLEKFPDEIFLGEAREEYRAIYKEIGEAFFASGRYAEAAESFVRIFELMQAVVPDGYAPALLFADMIRLVPAYRESGETALAKACGERALRYSRYVLSNGYGKHEQEKGISEEQWRSTLCLRVAELYFELALTVGKMGDTAKMVQYFAAAQTFAEQVGEEDEDNANALRFRIGEAMKNAAI